MKEDTIKLVRKAIKGSKSAYGELIAQYQIYLYKTAFLYVKNEADALDALKTQYKTVVILFYFQELKIKEIARIMDIPEGSVKADLYRAKQQLRQWLTDNTDNKKEVKPYAK